jgi:hypothetical protein
MDTTDATVVLSPLLKAAGIAIAPDRDPIRVWARSGVERLRLAGGGSVVLKYAEEPFDREHLALALTAAAEFPCPASLLRTPLTGCSAC